MTEPQDFGSAVADIIRKHPAGTPVGNVLQAMVRGHTINQRRRAAVLSHPDLRKRLEDELGYTSADNWNGFVPPKTVSRFSDPELCRQWKADRDGMRAAHFNEHNRHAEGEKLNDTGQRRVLVEIISTAWERREISGARQAEAAEPTNSAPATSTAHS